MCKDDLRKGKIYMELGEGSEKWQVIPQLRWSEDQGECTPSNKLERKKVNSRLGEDEDVQQVLCLTLHWQPGFLHLSFLWTRKWRVRQQNPSHCKKAHLRPPHAAEWIQVYEVRWHLSCGPEEMADMVAMPLFNIFEKLWLSDFLTGSHITFLELNLSDMTLNAVLFEG